MPCRCSSTAYISSSCPPRSEDGFDETQFLGCGSAGAVKIGAFSNNEMGQCTHDMNGMYMKWLLGAGGHRLSKSVGSLKAGIRILDRGTLSLFRPFAYYSTLRFQTSTR
ncbi:uncharacterized protein M421DRAFT_383753 [Didymella exigua CBS 183.55]|uniref:Uncharacterized protein n=1 Tax=Didymella exigua CBS 183.55 TaxID=1150837 RepID=A0A6A5RQZ2_9PLEO|nr:uncharacterized protein M421DRAFT_383753 [Didymella exigua CBS 183.55]KAF1930059.1 hypothetical protein M421DRAFT_383753 [Didymella exigua CBS 183.55]